MVAKRKIYANCSVENPLRSRRVLQCPIPGGVSGRAPLDLKNSSPSGGDSPQQGHLLFAYAASIQGCRGGQLEGLTVAYNQLPRDVKPIANSKGTTEQENAAHHYLDTFIQEKLEALLSTENQLMHELTGIAANKAIPQLSHQSLYVKNRLAPMIGLQHSLTFDQHTHHITEPLFEKTPLEILGAFLNHFSANTLVDGLQEQINRELRSKNLEEQNALYATLSSLIPNAPEDSWELNDEETEFSLTKRGALSLLIAADYLKIST